MHSDDIRHSLALLIPLTALAIPLVAIVGLVLRQLRREQLRHETIRLLVERDQPVPAQLFSNLESGPRRRDFSEPGVRRGVQIGALAAVGAGLGLMVMFYAMDPAGWQWSIGCIPLFTGLGTLLALRLDVPQVRHEVMQPGPDAG